MIVPEYWAKVKIHHNNGKQPLTIERLGWSDLSEEDARQEAQKRAEEALARWLDGENISYKEPNSYNGAEGLPIREQIVSRHEDIIITRNSYGALCLNTPDVAFADIDFYNHPFLSKANFFKEHWALILLGIILIISISIGLTTYNFNLFWVTLIITTIAFIIEANLSHEHHYYILLKKLEKFSQKHPNWGFRLYETPAGLRILFTHQTFSPQNPDIKKFFHLFKVDHFYALMCQNQQCFRARLTAKPWRIGIKSIHPKGFWSNDTDTLKQKQVWVNKYQIKAKEFAACHFIKSFGNQNIDDKVMKVVELHDHFCKAFSYLPLA